MADELAGMATPRPLSHPERTFGIMYGGEEHDLLTMLGAIARDAGTDPDRCVALAALVRACARDLTATEIVNGREQDRPLRRGQIGIGHDRGLNVGHTVGADRNPTQAA